MATKSKGKTAKKKGKRRAGIPPGCVQAGRVMISEASGLSVDHPCVVLSKRNLEHVTWKHAQNKSFVVSFDAGSPFDDDIFYPDHDDSGPPHAHADEKSYKYTVRAGGLKLDPRVIIDK